MSQVADLDKLRRADLAETLKRDEAFNLFKSEVLDGTVNTFLNPTSSIEELAEAHAIVRGIKTLEGHIDRQIDERAFQEHRERKHRD